MIGRDTRESGSELEDAIVEGCAAEGVAVHLMGVVPTPAIAYASNNTVGWALPLLRHTTCGLTTASKCLHRAAQN